MSESEKNPRSFAQEQSKARGSAKRSLRGKYDSAQTTRHNQNHWSLADGLSPTEATREGIRQTLRNRSRYETANNSYCRGIVETVADDTIGTGPRAQLIGEGVSESDLSKVEKLFWDWAGEVMLSQKIRQMRRGKSVDGEAFGVFGNNEALPERLGVTLDIKLVEPEQVVSSLDDYLNQKIIDGVELNSFGTPVAYHLTTEHPGDSTYVSKRDLVKLNASEVMHYFSPDRPGQVRGIPELTPALPLFSQLRRYTLATLTAAETAADFALVLQTNSPADGEADPAVPFEVVDLERGAATVAPEGWAIAQVKPEQPVTAYSEFKREILCEAARAIGLPKGKALLDSSEYNYASGKLDNQNYHKAIGVERKLIERLILDRVFHAWLDEAVLVEGLLPQSARSSGPRITVKWFWDGFEHADPTKEANAQTIRLENNTTTLADECASAGRDWKDVLTQRAEEMAFAKKIGLGAAVPGQEDPGPEEVEEEEEVADAE